MTVNRDVIVGHDLEASRLGIVATGRPVGQIKDLDEDAPSTHWATSALMPTGRAAIKAGALRAP